ncbi:probable serine/threonine-protein kinase cdc7 [Condylostylus longicornis]|uniref:probable serine/threonine-protein kinase cdc7 n=1 Tax=Condylostylus longicornis TaxID=2530218 RepID=UPI00244E2039|nr:probable serine/threonine-protein kinase cdc7 [Condylostylus longicornis]
MIPQYHQQLQNYPDQLHVNDKNQLFQQNNQQKEQHTLQESQLQQKLQIEQQQQRLLNEHLQRQQQKQQFQITQLPYHTIKSQNSDVILTIQPLRNAASTSNLYSTTKPKPVTRNSFSNNNQNLLGINMLGNTSTIGNRSELLLSSQRHQRDLFSGELGIPEIKTHVGSVVHTFETMGMLQDRINKSKLEPILIGQSDKNPFNDNEESFNLTPEDQTKNYSRNTVVGRIMEQSDNSIKNSQPVRKKKRSYKSCPPPPPPVDRNIEQLKAKDRETETKEISTNQYEYHHAQHHNSTTDNIEDEVVNKAFKDIFISYGDGDELDDENSFDEIYQHNTMPITSQNQEKLIMKQKK